MTTFEYTPPNQLEGDVYEVAGAACDQAAAVAELLCDAIDGAFRMARVAEMEREMNEGLEPQERCSFYETALGRRLDQLNKRSSAIQHTLSSVSAAASFDPNAPDEID